jgi:hypothetical protein
MAGFRNLQKEKLGNKNTKANIVLQWALSQPARRCGRRTIEFLRGVIKIRD